MAKRLARLPLSIMTLTAGTEFVFTIMPSHFKVAIPTMSLGRAVAGHTLEAKLRAAAGAGFEAVEVRTRAYNRFSK
jgi:hypothetical protein